MKRRQVLTGLGAVGGGGTLLTGTGAFTSVSARRNISVQVADDSDAFLGLIPTTSPNASAFADTQNGQLVLDFSDTDAGGSGLGTDSTYHFDSLFRVINQGTQPVYIWATFSAPDGTNTNLQLTGSDPDIYFYPNGDSATVLGDDAPHTLFLPVGESATLGLYVDTTEAATGTLNLQTTINADAATSRGNNENIVNRSGQPILSTGIANWRVTEVPDSAGISTPTDATTIEPPSAWASPATLPIHAYWVDPFGTGELKSDPADNDDPYVYELSFDVPPGGGDLEIVGYGADNPVTMLLDGQKIASRGEEEAFDPFKSTTKSGVPPGSHTLQAEVINSKGANGNPTGLLIAAQLQS